MKIKNIAEAIEEAHGNLSLASKNLGITRATIYKRIKADPKLQLAADNARETMLDHAESILYQKVLEGETIALFFFLKTQGKRRGFVERQEVTGPEGGRIIIELDSGPKDKSATEPVQVSIVPS
jgi:hypothetical protein